MKKYAGVLLLCVCLAGCHSQQYKLASLENEYWDMYIDYEQQCPQASTPATPACRQIADTERDLQLAAKALARGGSIAPQMRRAKKDLNGIRRVDRSNTGGVRQVGGSGGDSASLGRERNHGGQSSPSDTTPAGTSPDTNQ